MPNWQRHSIIGILITTLAACTGAPQATPAASPTAGAVPTAGASAIGTATPRPTPWPSPSEGCIDPATQNPNGPFIDASADLGKFGLNLQATRIEPLSTRWSVFEPTPRVEDESARQLILGGHGFRTYPSYYYDGYTGPISMESAIATLTIDGASPSELATRIVPGNENFDQVEIAVPDVAAHGTLNLTFVWADNCNRFTASGSVTVETVPAAVTEGCALEKDGYLEQLQAVIAKGLIVGPETARFFVPDHRAKYFDYENPGIDAFLEYSFDPEDPAISAAPDSALRVENPNPDLHLRDMDLTVWTRKSIVSAVKEYPPKGAVVVLHRTPNQQADGSWRLRVPAQPGRYVAGIIFGFDTACGSGFIWATVNVTVLDIALTTLPASTTEPSPWLQGT